MRIERRRAGYVLVAILNVLLATLCTRLTSSDEGILTIARISMVLFVILCAGQREFLLLLARTFILGSVGYFAIAVKAFAGTGALFSLYEPTTQGFDIAVIMYQCTTVALLGNEIGLLVGLSGDSHAEEVTPAVADADFWRAGFWCSVVLVPVVSFLLIRMAPSILVAGYASEIRADLPLGNVDVIGAVGLMTMYVATRRTRIFAGRTLIVAMSFVFLVWGMLLRGLRQDVITTLFGLVICIELVRRRPFRLRASGFVFVAIGVVFFELLGVARGALAAGTSLSELWDALMGEYTGKLGVYHIGTYSPIATTFANMVYLVKTGQLGHLWGLSYWQFIPRTPPEFLYPNRPKDLALIFEHYGLASGGGVFELAEAYLNFGLAGCLIMPAVLSALMARFYRKCFERQRPIDYFLVFSFLAIFLRGTWYQVFAFYKSFITCLILYGAFQLFAVILRHYQLRTSVADPGSALTT